MTQAARAQVPDKGDLDHHDRLGFLVAQVGRATTRRVGAALRPLGIKPRHLMALDTLGWHGAMSQQALGEALNIDPSNLVALLNHLEAEGLATRRRDTQDRRRHVVEISKRGQKRLNEVHQTTIAVDHELFGVLSPEEREQLMKLLERVAGSTQLPTRIEMIQMAVDGNR